MKPNNGLFLVCFILIALTHTSIAQTAKILCQKPSSCDEYSQDLDYVFTIDQNGLDPLNTYTITWTVTPSTLQNTANGPFLLIPNTADLLNFANLQIDVSLVKNSNTLSDTKTLPRNDLPTINNINLTPTTGHALTDQFTITVDATDNNAPISYLYSLQSPEDKEELPLTIRNTENTLKVYLPAKDSPSRFYITVQVTDKFGSTQIKSKKIVISQSQFVLNSIIEQIETFSNDQIEASSVTIAKKFENLVIMQKQIEYIQSKAIGQTTLKEACDTGCSGRGECESTSNIICNCQAGFTLHDCSMNSRDFSLIEEKSSEIVNVAQKHYKDADTKYRNITLNLMALSAKSVFTNEASFFKIQEMLNHYMEQTDFTIEEIKTFGIIIDNLIKNVKENGCILNHISLLLIEGIHKYMEVIGKLSLSSYYQIEDAFKLLSTNFDITTKKSNQCSLKDLTLNFGSQATPKITLKYKDQTNCDANKEVQVIAYLFDYHSISCETSLQNKNAILVKILDENGSQDVTSSYKAEVTLDANDKCPDSCQRIQGSVCGCEAMTNFNVTTNLNAIFNRNHLRIVRPPLNYKLERSVQSWLFWTFIFWGGITTLIVILVIPKFCIVERVANSREKTPFKKFSAILVGSHPLLEIYTYKHPRLSKFLRAFLYFQRLMLLMAFVSCYQALSKESIPDGKAKIQWNLFLILLPIITVIPIYHLLRFFSQSKAQSKHQIEKPLPNSTKKKIFYNFFVLGLSLMAIYWIDSRLYPDERRAWGFAFLQCAFQDIFINSLLSIILESLFFGLWNLKFIQSNEKRKENWAKIIDVRFFRVYGIIRVEGPGIPSSSPHQLAPTEQTHQDAKNIDTMLNDKNDMLTNSNKVTLQSPKAEEAPFINALGSSVAHKPSKNHIMESSETNIKQYSITNVEERNLLKSQAHQQAIEHKHDKSNSIDTIIQFATIQKPTIDENKKEGKEMEININTNSNSNSNNEEEDSKENLNRRGTQNGQNQQLHISLNQDSNIEEDEPHARKLDEAHTKPTIINLGNTPTPTPKVAFSDLDFGQTPISVGKNEANFGHRAGIVEEAEEQYEETNREQNQKAGTSVKAMQRAKIFDYDIDQDEDQPDELVVEKSKPKNINRQSTWFVPKSKQKETVQENENSKLSLSMSQENE